jgi:2-polyprenyl-3-methyl-5-hydroxy-6-metoxy-1,4-benzoquinol methylase
MFGPMHLPRFVVRAVLALRRGLQRAADTLVPPALPLLERIGGLEVTASLSVVAELGIADRLAVKPQTAAELAAATGVNPDALARLLRTLVAQGCFRLGGDGRYRNNRLSNGLRSGQNGSLRDFARYFGSTSNLSAWTGLAPAVLDGKSAFERVHGVTTWEAFARDPKLGAMFAGAMSELTAFEAPFLASAYPFERHQSICDIGGGQGTLLAAILATHPTVHGCLVDGAAALEGAREHFRTSGLEGRVDLMAADFFGELPAGHDAYLMKDVLHDWDDPRAKRILENCQRAMKPGSRLLISELLLEAKEARFPGTFADLQMLVVCSEGRQRSLQEMVQLLDGAGFRLVKVWKTTRFSSWVEAEIAPRDSARDTR